MSSAAQVESLSSISALLLLESLPSPACVLPALPFDEVLIQRVRVARSTDPEAWGNSLLPPAEEEATMGSIRVVKAQEARRPQFKRTDSTKSDSAETVITGSPGGHRRTPTTIPLAYPGIAGPEADVGMRHSLREIATPIWVNASWRAAFQHDGGGPFSIFELLKVEDGIRFCEFIQEVLLSARRSVIERRPVTVALDLQPSAWRALPPEQRVVVPIKLVGNIVSASESIDITESTFLVITFAAEIVLPSFSVMPPLTVADLNREEDLTPIDDVSASLGDGEASQFILHASKHANPQAPMQTLPDGFIVEGSSRQRDINSRKRRRPAKPSFGSLEGRSPSFKSALGNRSSPPPTSEAAVVDEDTTPQAMQRATEEMQWATHNDLPQTTSKPPAASPGLALDSRTIFEHKLAGSEMGRAILRYPWHTTSLGPIQSWSAALQTCVHYCMASPFREALWVGEELLMIYNEGYSATAGKKHPWLLGKAGAVAWAELWDELKPSALRMMSGQTITSYDGLLFMDRNEAELGSSRLEETYFTWAWIPIFDADGKFVAAHNPAFESTSRVIAERRLATLREIVQTTSLARDTSSYCKAALAGMSGNPFDCPFALLYSCARPHSQRHQSKADRLRTPKNTIKLRLEGTLGVPEGHPSAPAELILRAETNATFFEQAGSSQSQSLEQSVSNTGSSSGQGSGSFSDDDNLPWPFVEAITTGKPVFVSKLGQRVDGFTPRGWDDPCSAAVVLPIASDDASTHAIAIVGLNPRRPWNEVYGVFFQLLSRQLATGLATVLSYEQAQAKADELAALDKARNAFFQNCSHELRTPLTLILGPLEDVLTLQEPLPAAAREQLLTVNRNANRLLRLVNSLLDFSKLEAGRMLANFTPVNLGEMTADLASLFRSSIERAGILYEVDCDEMVPVQGVFVDADLYEKAIVNLLGNAFKYTIKGRIAVSLHYELGSAVFRVKDSGCGIAEEEREHIFERFHRVDSVGRSIEGTGIGLALTLSCVKTFGGTLEVDSTLGVGSTFTIRIPLGRSHLPNERLTDQYIVSSEVGERSQAFRQNALDQVTQWSTNDPRSQNGTIGEYIDESAGSSTAGSTLGDHLPAESGPLSLPGSRVLIADDNQDMRRYCKSILSSAHYTIIERPDGASAFQYAISDPPDLIVSDVMMPHLDGFGLLARLRAHPRTHLVPFILLSAKAGAEARVDGLMAGADDYLVKPFSAKELLARVANHLAMGKMRRELEKRVDERTLALTESEGRARELASRLSIVTDLSPVGIFSTDGTGQLLFVNPQFHNICGIPPDAPLNGWLLHVHEDFRQDVQRKFAQAISERIPTTIEFRWSNGVWTQLGIHPLEPLDDRADARFVGSLTDTSELKRLEALHISSLEQRAAEAEQMRRLQELSIDVSSHELRNPLSGLHQNAELIAGSFRKAKSQIHELQSRKGDVTAFLTDLDELIDGDTESIESILLCSAHMQRISHDILAFSKANMGLLTLVIRPFSMRELVEGCLRMFRAELKNHDVAAKITYDTSVVALQAECIQGDPHRLSQVLINFLTNAVRFLTPRPIRNIELAIAAYPIRPAIPPNALRIDSEMEPPVTDTDVWVSASVTDTGPGLSAEESKKLFRRFGQANPTQDSLTGFGLGLFVSRKIVELHGGFIQVESVKDQGSTFGFCIPTRRADPPAASARRASGSALQLPPSLNRAESVKIATSNAPSKPPTGVRRPSNPVSPSSGPKKSRGTILVADDNMINLRVLVRQLQQHQYDTISARDGLEALNAYKEHHTALYAALLDLEMPVMDGLESIRNIREFEERNGLPQCLIIAVTGNARDAQIEASLKAGFDDVATKPYNLMQLLARIEDRPRT